MAVLIDNRQNKKKGILRSTKKAAQAILNALGSPEAELSVLIVDDPQIALMNQAYLAHEGPTNVISFPQQEGPFPHISPLLGDVVISAETADREAKAAGIPFQERFLELLIHGILHLSGYDHVTNENDAAIMEQKTQALLGMVLTAGSTGK